MCITSFTRFTSFKNFKRKIFAVTFSAIMLCMSSCVTDPVDPPTPPDLPPVWIAVATIATDYSAANFELVLREDYSTVTNLLGDHNLHTDIAMRSFDGALYILERMGKDNIIKYGGQGIEYQQSLGEGKNIQDIAVVSDNRAYISAHNDYKLIVFDPSDGTILRSAVDLSQFNSFAGTEDELPTPYVSSLAYYNNTLYAACQRLNAAFDVGDVSLIAVIDTRTNEVTGSIELAKKNPASMSMFGNRMLVSSQGSWMETGGEYAGIEIIDIDENENLGVIIDGNTLNGNPSDIIFVAYDKAYVVVMGNDFTSFVVVFDPTTGIVGARIDGIGDASGGLAFDGEKLYVGDRDLESFGVAVVDILSDEVLLTIPTNMPPSALAVVR